jgi:Undecaprenyl-phosphate galactose phosphotransferase WbaP
VDWDKVNTDSIRSSKTEDALARNHILEEDSLKASPLFSVFVIALSDLIAVTLSIILGLLIRAQFGPVAWIESYFQMWPLLFIVIITFAGFGLYPGLGLSPANELRRLTYAISIVFIFLAGLTFIIRAGWIFSRSVFILAWFFGILFVPLVRSITRTLVSRTRRWGIPVVVVTNTKKGHDVVEVLLKNRKAGYRPVALLDDTACETNGELKIGSLEMAPLFAKSFGLKHAVLVFPFLSPSELGNVIDHYCVDYPHLLVVPSILSDVHIWVTPLDLVGNLGLEIQQNLLSPTAQLVKRAVDLVLSLLLLIMLAPVLFVISIALRIDSPGPIFYYQERVGKGGKLFRLVKFRTMVADADSRLEEHLEVDTLLRQEWEQHQKLSRDPRITSVGRWLRRFSLDELPQLLNVVGGEMSLVGPRPMLVDQKDLYGNPLQLYLRVTPGITGLWQISGRNRTTFQERARFDSYYVRNWSIWHDFYILVKTPLTVLKGEGAF